MRDELRRALQGRWEDSLRARAAVVHTHSPFPLLDELLAAFRERARQKSESAAPRDCQEVSDTGGREKMISQNRPNSAESPGHESGLGLKERASDLVRDQNQPWS
jgi:hypothetical protein